MISLIFAIDRNGLVGSTTAKYGLPWHYSEDLKYYKTMTVGKTCIMGRKTFEAIGRPLPNRKTIVLTTNKNIEIENVEISNDLLGLINKYVNSEDEIFICGGVEIFKQFIKYAKYIYITKINEDHQGDIYFKDLDLKQFELINSINSKDNLLEFQTWELKNEEKQI